jgi:hypothetical protein
MLASLLQRPELSIDQTRQIAKSLYYSSPEGSEEELFATSILLALLSHTDNQRDVYRILKRMVPQFHKLSLIEAHSVDQIHALHGSNSGVP